MSGFRHKYRPLLTGKGSWAIIGAISFEGGSGMQNKYDATTIQVLSGIEAVRKRPAMYIGDTSILGLHHLIYEVVDNSIDEAMAGSCTEIKVAIHPDNSVTVEDNGRGIPVDIHKTEKRPALEVVMTVLHAGGKFDKKAYRVSGGLHGVGVSVVNALAEWLEVEVKRDGEVHHQRYERGMPVTKVTVIGKSKETGTKVTFRPDEEIFEAVEFDDSILAGRLRDLAFLNAGLVISFVDERTLLNETYKFDGGLVSFVEYLNKNKKVIFSPPVYFKKEAEDIEVELSFQYHDGYNETLFSFANNVNTKEGGTHVTGLRGGLTRALNDYAKNNKILDMALSGEDMREGLTAVVSIKIAEPQFEGQTKMKLGNSRVRFLVEGVVSDSFLTYLEEHPEPARDILNKCVMTAKAREAARKARDLTRKKLSESGALPGKLADCSSKDPQRRELFLVEGDSAGGSAKQGRDREFQAILPLKGKIINTEKAPLEKVLNNEEIKMMIAAIGSGVSEEFDIIKARYAKIIIMTDADFDGAHIRTLLLTFFYRQMTDLIRNGFVYIAQPPLYKVKRGKKESYIDTENDMDKMLVDMGKENVEISFSNKKGPLPTERIAEFSKISKRFAEIKRMIDQKGLNFAKYLDAWKKMKVFPVYWVKTKDGEQFIADESRLSQFMSEQDGGGDDLFSKESKEYRMIELFESREMEKVWKNVSKLDVTADELTEKIFTVKENGSTTASSLLDLFDLLKENGKKGMTVQRYKGLGEMNPEQLWETTMDPVARRLKRVTLEDASRAEELFTVLMGEEVEPRRQFIERFAREVKNLDI